MHREEEVSKQRGKELFKKSCNLEEVNTALKVLVKHRDKDMIDFEKGYCLI